MNATRLLSALFVFTAPCFAQDPPKQPTQPFVLAAGETSLGDLIERCAEYLGHNILTSPQEMANSGAGGAQSIRLQHQITTDRNGCEELLTAMLYRSSFALVPLDAGKTFEVISMVGPRGREPFARAQERTVEQVLSRPNLKIVVTTVVHLKHASAVVATNALRPFFATQGPMPTLNIGNLGNEGAMLLTGFQDQVAQAIRLIQASDLPGPPEAGAPLSDRLIKLERRVKALEERLAPPTQGK